MVRKVKVPEGMHIVDLGNVDLTPDSDNAYNIYTALNQKGGCEYASECRSCLFPKCKEDYTKGSQFLMETRRFIEKTLYQKGLTLEFIKFLFTTKVSTWETDVAVIRKEIKEEEAGTDEVRHLQA